MISIDDKSIYVSEIQEKRSDGRHFRDKSTAYQEEVLKKIKERGFTIEQLATDNYARAKFNILDTLEWYNKLHASNRVEKGAKVDLGW